MKILICDPIADEATMELMAMGVEVDRKDQLQGKSLQDIIHQYHGLIIGQETQLDQHLLEQATALKVIGKIGKDSNNIDLEAATAKGIVVVNSSIGVSTSIAEYALFLLLYLCREHKSQSMAGLGSKLLGVELKGKTLGIIGLGNVGIQVAKRAKAFDLRIVCYDPSVSRARAMMYEVELLDLVDLLIISDFISIHAPLNELTKGLLHKDHLSLLKEGVSIINTASPEIIRHQDLPEALISGKIAHMALDLPKGYDQLVDYYRAYPQVLITHNQGVSTVEAQLGIAEEIVTEMIQVWEVGISQNAINIPLVKDNLLNLFKPFQVLAKTLGNFLGQMIEAPIKEIAITYRGDLASYDVAPLTQTILQYLLSHLTTDPINYVNVAHWAKARDIAVTIDQSTTSDDYPNYIGIKVSGNAKTRAIAGNVLNSGEIKIIQLDDFSLEIKPEAHFLIVPHLNKPGQIGLAGTILGNQGINITGMTLGRTTKADVALMVMSVDRSASKDVIATLENDPSIFEVTYIKL